MKVINAVAHKLNKKAKIQGAKPDPAEELLENTDELAELMSDLLETFNEKTAQRTGVFENDQGQYPFGSSLAKYLDGGISFIDFTADSLKQLAFLIQDVYPASGGYILFAHYNVSAGSFFVVAKLNDTEGKVFSDDRKKVLKNFHLSLDKLHHVGRVNIGGWKNSASKYLTFVNARENGKSSDYFVKFLGCSTATKPRVETGKLVAVIEAFCAEKKMEISASNEFKASVYNHAKSLQKGTPVSLAALANAVWPGDPRELIKFVNDREDAPSDDFFVDHSTLKPLVGYTVKVPGLRLWMTNEFKTNHNVRFTKDNELIISDAAAFRDELE
jgi:nucleoid-associated protein